jgi:hypothetical protein
MMRGKEEGGRVGVDLFCQLLNVHLLHGGDNLHHLDSEVNKSREQINNSVCQDLDRYSFIGSGTESKFDVFEFLLCTYTGPFRC